jgi:inosine/xanthosine triphosphatase
LIKKVVITSKNPAKIEAVTQGFTKGFPDEQFEFVASSTPSGVSDQPMSDKETLEGAENRVQSAKLQIPEADFWVGVEAGLELINNHLFAFNWVVVLSVEVCGYARSGAFMIPENIRKLISSGKELGDAADEVFSKNNLKHGSGTVGLLTNGNIDRKSLIEQAVLLALAPHLSSNLY